MDKKRIKSAIKSSGKKLLRGDYNVTGKLNRVGAGARIIGGNFVKDFNSDGGTGFSFASEAESPFRMGNTAEVIPALQRNRQPHRQRHRNRHTRKPRKVVYY